eukprot:TRINITY_DN1096_c0_g1_i1.p1 TRINITY_DN1096_c0_g1~~TRINITY_DN1096_c0_g1_i1.p1  ORF type:complete len:155 (-),score=29.81 TRINITY_DN1096_c0_g1_i1:97-561(-)
MSETLFNVENLNFLVLGAPEPFELPKYVKTLQKNNVKNLVCCCERKYDLKPFEENGIKVIEWVFNDGQSPPDELIEEWLKFVQSKGKDGTIGVHCQAGLGRAPMLVAIVMIESGMEPLDAIEKIRKKRRSAFNKTQVDFLMKYKKRKQKGCDLM